MHRRTTRGCTEHSAYGSKQWHGGHRCERRPIKFHFSVTVQWKQANLEANDGWGENEKEDVCGSDGSSAVYQRL